MMLLLRYCLWDAKNCQIAKDGLPDLLAGNMFVTELQADPEEALKKGRMGTLKLCERKFSR